jgi:hypothetical protein
VDRIEFNVLLKDLAWPVTVLFVTLLFRAEFRRTLGRLASLRYRDFEASFERGLREAEVLVKPGIGLKPQPLVETANDSAVANGLISPRPEGHERLLRVADVSPSAAIMEAWRDVEHAAHAAGEALGIGRLPGEGACSHAMHALVDKGLLSSHALVAYERLRRLHEQAAHRPDLRFSSNQAHRYVELAHKLVARLSAVADPATTAA